jgi:multidrug resistance efflux pump
VNRDRPEGSGSRPSTRAETLAELEQRTREYQDTLARLLAREEQVAVQATATAERYRTLHAEGLVSRRDVEEAEQAVADAQARLDATRSQLADSQRIVVEA